jgi:hypothetical protein
MSGLRPHGIHGRCRPALVALAVAVAAACGGSIIGVDPSTGLSVVVLRGPIQPVAMEGESNSEPVEGAVVRVRGLDRGGSTEGRTGVDGSVLLLLQPGSYEVEVRNCPRALLLPSPDTVEVRAGFTETIALECDTGIR